VEARFSAPVQNGSCAPPASYAMDTEWSFPWVKGPGRGVGHPLPSRTGVQGRTELYSLSSFAFMVNIFNYESKQKDATYLLTPWSRVLLEKLTSKLCS